MTPSKNCGNAVTLREIMHSDEPWSYEFRARLVNARDRGLIAGWECDRTVAAQSGRVSDHVYRIIPKVAFKTEPDGQTVFA